MLETGVTELSDSPWHRLSVSFCVDYRWVNAVSKRGAFSIPDIHDGLDHLRGSRYFATIDLLPSYWQLGMTEAPKNVLHFVHGAGYSNSPACRSALPGRQRHAFRS